MASSARFEIQRLNGSNYETWRDKLELLLIKDKVWTVIRDPTPTPDKMDQNWLDKDDQARATIGLLVEDSQLIHIRGAKSAKQAWEALKNYHQKASLSNTVFLLKDICRMNLAEGGNLEEHLTEMLNRFDRLTALGKPLDEKISVAMILCSLPESYRIRQRKAHRRI